MVEISLVTGSDRLSWKVLARGSDRYSGIKRSNDDYEQTWRGLLDGERTRGIVARLDGKVAGLAHYVFHAGIWGSGRCYLADLFVTPEIRRRGVATAMINWVAGDAEEHGFPRLYWNALDDAPARLLYDKVADLNRGLVVYSYRRNAHQGSTRR